MGDITRLTDEQLIEFLRNTDDESHPTEDPSVHQDAFGYQPTRYGQLERIAEFLGLGRDDVFVDLGCGKGRVVCFMALQGLRRVVGVELRRDFAELARENARRLGAPTPVEIVVADAASYRSPDATIYYLFNPFGRRTVEAVLDNVLTSWEASPRPVRVVYNNPLHADAPDGRPWLERVGEIGTGWGIRVWRTVPPAVYLGARRPAGLP